MFLYPIVKETRVFAAYKSENIFTNKIEEHIFNDFLRKKLEFNSLEECQDWCKTKNKL